MIKYSTVSENPHGVSETPETGCHPKRIRRIIGSTCDNGALIIKSDSDRVTDLLPGRNDVESPYPLHYIKRRHAMKKLLRIHYRQYVRRSKPVKHTGGMMQYPLLDCSQGMGKSTFGSLYLAMVQSFLNESPEERRISELAQALTEPHLLRTDDFKECNCQLVLGPDEHFVEGFASELESAGTLHVRFLEGSLSERSKMLVNFLSTIIQALEQKWGYTLPDEAQPTFVTELLHHIPKPIFFVLDDIGTAFQDLGGSVYTQRENFYYFLRTVCNPMTRASGVYYLLCGSAPFLWNVVFWRKEAFEGRVERLHLNSLQEHEVEELLKNTFYENQSLSDRLKGKYRYMETVDINHKLCFLTAGNPGAILERLKSDDPLSVKHIFPQLLDDVKEAVKRYPDEVRELFDSRDGSSLDLGRIIGPTMYSMTLENIASRLGAVFDEKIHDTKLYIPRIVEEYLESYFSGAVESSTE
jgi:hypothetical protein